jgi:hypothetical protein
MTAGGLTPWAGLRRHWLAALAHGSALLLPVGHLIALKLDPSPKEYTIPGISWESVSLWPKALLASFGFSYLVAALVLLAVAFWRAYQSGALATDQSRTDPPLAIRAGWVQKVVAALLLIVAGVGIYLPMPPGVSGRYTVPAVWGFDLLLALAFSVCFALPPSLWKRVGIVALIVGLAGILVANVGKQTKWQGRADLFWQVADLAEKELPAGSKLAWVGVPLPRGDELGLGEGIHFRWHLERRGRSQLSVELVDLANLHGLTDCDLACTAHAEPPAQGWQLSRTFESSYWMGLRTYRSYLWKARTRGGN